MHPIAFEIGSVSVRYYGVMAAIGFLLASAVISWNRKYADMNRDQANAMVLLVMISGVVGARIFYVIQFYRQFESNFWSIFRIDRGGLVFYGGFFLAIAAAMVYCRMQKLDIARVFDIFTPALALGHAMGRIGCFLNGCCYGKPTEICLGMAYPPGSDPFRRYGAATLHPVQLYEAAINLVIFAAMMWIVRRGKRGMAIGAYLAIYGVIRFTDEFLRGDHQRYWNGLTAAQVIGLILVPIGVGVMIHMNRRGKEENA